MRGAYYRYLQGGLPTFSRAFQSTFTISNIQRGFREVGIIPYDPEYAISQLDVKLHALTPPATSSGLPTHWELKTQHNLIEAES